MNCNGPITMPDLDTPALAFAGLLIATALYLLMIRRRGRDRHRRHADEWDRAMSQARSVQRLERLADQDRQPPSSPDT